MKRGRPTKATSKSPVAKSRPRYRNDSDPDTEGKSKASDSKISREASPAQKVKYSNRSTKNELKQEVEMASEPGGKPRRKKYKGRWRIRIVSCSKLVEDNQTDDRDEGDYYFKCLHCHVEVSSAGKKKWTLASYLNLKEGFTLSVYEGMSLFFEHYKCLNPLARLEPQSHKEEYRDGRQICIPCISRLRKFCVGLQLLVQRCNKDSVLSEAAGDLELEKEYFKTKDEPKIPSTRRVNTSYNLRNPH